jgi:cell wall-associated NlpC family hydrolase
MLVLALVGTAFAEQTLTITLDPPKTESRSDLHLSHETLGATRNAAARSQKQYSAQVGASKQSSAGKTSAIGRVGIITAATADIMRMPTSRGYSLFTCTKDTYLAIVSECENYYGTLMVDGSTGWVLKSKVNLLNYQVMGPSGGDGVGGKIVQTALRYLGIPYRWGGCSGSGIDCSGFVKSVFANHGVSLPRVARDQATVGTPVTYSQLQAGDRLYFSCKGDHVDHAGIYMGNGLFIHSSVRNKGVAVDKITEPFFLRSLVAARRS